MISHTATTESDQKAKEWFTQKIMSCLNPAKFFTSSDPRELAFVRVILKKFPEFPLCQEYQKIDDLYLNPKNIQFFTTPVSKELFEFVRQEIDNVYKFLEEKNPVKVNLIEPTTENKELQSKNTENLDEVFNEMYQDMVEKYEPDLHKQD